MTFTVGFLVALSLSQAAAPAAAGRISGHVIAEGANTPIAGARVMLLPSRMPTGPFGLPPQTLTDQSGRFVFERVAPGEYHVEVQKAGFASLADPTQRPPTITVAAGESRDDVDVRLQRGGAITGRVLDANGEPVPDTSVMAMRRVPSAPAGMPFVPAPMQGGQQTNDLGEFRMSGLAPGEYVIAAMPRSFSPFGGPNVAPPAAGSSRMTPATTFYPGTTDQGSAETIVVAPGAEVANLVLTMQTAPAFTVSGVVVDESGSPIAHAMVMLMGDPRSGMFGPAGTAQSQEDGRFVMASVPPGSYRVTATIMMIDGAAGRSVTGGGAAATWSSGASGGGSGSFVTFSAGAPNEMPAEVVVSGADVENVRVVTRRPKRQ